jgi:hypothetical protein
VAGRFSRKNSARSGGKGAGREITMINPATMIGRKSQGYTMMQRREECLWRVRSHFGAQANSSEKEMMISQKPAEVRIRIGLITPLHYQLVGETVPPSFTRTALVTKGFFLKFSSYQGAARG